MQLKGGVGEAGDAYERHADQIADAVVCGESAERILDQHAGGAGGGAVQRQAVQHKPDTSMTASSAPAAPADNDHAAHLIHLLGSPPTAGSDPVATYLSTLDTLDLLATMSGAADRGYLPQLRTHLASARPLLVAALHAIELAPIAPVPANHQLLQRAGVALDQISRDQQLQILSYLLRRRGASVEAATLVEGVLALRAGADHDNAAASKEPQPAGAGRGAGDPAGSTGHDEQAAGAAIGASVAAGAAGPAPINPGPWAPPGDQPGGFYVGTAAHTAIAGVYQLAHSADQVFTNTTPIVSILRLLAKMANGSKVDVAALAEDELARRA